MSLSRSLTSAVATVVAASSLCWAGTTTRVSVSSTGQEGNGWSGLPSISADGRCVAFESRANKLVPDDSNGYFDIFVHDRATGATTRVSVSSSGQEGEGDSERPSISADGRCVAFHSYAGNLVPGDTNGCVDVFVYERVVMPPPSLASTEPLTDGTLPKTQNNVILLTFDGPIWLPGGPALNITNLHDSADVSSSFNYSIEPGGQTLKAKESGAVLVNQNWYRVTPGASFDVLPFTRDFCTLQGDADSNGQVLAQDYFPVKNRLFQITDSRYDLDGSGQILASDYFVIKNHLFQAKPPKP